jgi:hypothetical protein
MTSMRRILVTFKWTSAGAAPITEGVVNRTANSTAGREHRIARQLAANAIGGNGNANPRNSAGMPENRRRPVVEPELKERPGQHLSGR